MIEYFKSMTAQEKKYAYGILILLIVSIIVTVVVNARQNQINNAAGSTNNPIEVVTADTTVLKVGESATIEPELSPTSKIDAVVTENAAITYNNGVVTGVCESKSAVTLDVVDKIAAKETEFRYPIIVVGHEITTIPEGIDLYVNDATMPPITPREGEEYVITVGDKSIAESQNDILVGVNFGKTTVTVTYGYRIDGEFCPTRAECFVVHCKGVE